MVDYLVPVKAVRAEQLVKKSKFITYIVPVVDLDAVQTTLTRFRQQYSDASHVCWAYIVGEPGNTTLVSCSDDGEPAGTAGKPMLNVLQHSDAGDVLAVVVRYFGGTKLGTGGLMRAYSAGVTETLKLVQLAVKVTMTDFSLFLPYALEDVCRRMLDKQAATINNATYGTELCLECTCPQEYFVALSISLADAGRGQIRINKD